jgi:hypothetical protein
MKKLTINSLLQLHGGGCGKWVRRYTRAYKNGADDATLDSLRESLDDCILEKYY